MFFTFCERTNAMKCAKLLNLGLLVVAMMAAGCSNATDTKPAATDTKGAKSGGAAAEHPPHGAGPNGGVVFDLGSHHAEFTADHGKKECTILILGDDEKTPTVVAATEFILNIKETKTKEGKVVAPMTITMLPANAADGKASKFVGADPGIGNVADFAGTVSGEIDGKPAQGEFKE
jgi:hypothetical protein